MRFLPTERSNRYSLFSLISQKILSLLVLGVLTGCSGESPAPVEEEESVDELILIVEQSGGASNDSPPPPPLSEAAAQCGSNAQTTCGDWQDPTTCQCLPDAPLDPSDCQEPTQFQCRQSSLPVSEEQAAFSGRNFELNGDCFCDETAPTGPDSCASPSEYKCMSRDQLSQCLCMQGAPAQPQDCDAPAAFRCQFYEPEPTGCDCLAALREYCNWSHAGLLCDSARPDYDCVCINYGR